MSVTRMMTLARTEGEGPTTGQFRSIFTSSKETGECHTGLARLDLKFDVFRRGEQLPCGARGDGAGSQPRHRPQHLEDDAG